MRKLNAVALATLVAMGLSAGAGASGGSNLNLDEMAAALALPIITGAQAGNFLKNSSGDVVITAQSAVTLATITNGKTTPVRLKLDLISGDPGGYYGGDQWQSTSFECDLTGRETTTFVFMPSGGTSKGKPGDGRSQLYVECSDLARSKTDGSPRALFTNVQNGVMFAAVADPASGDVVSEDIIFGDAVVVDFAQGQAYSFEAIAFQAGQGQNNGDKVYRFDNQEYAKFPAVLASNFIAPIRTNKINAELILITLDGGTGNVPTPRARLGGLGYNDDEQYFDFQWEFDCFDIASLLDIDPNFEFVPGSPLGLGSMSGHLQLVPQPVATANDAHDAQHGDGNSVRRRGVHGWIVQNVTSGSDIVVAGNPVPGTPKVTNAGGPAAWGRPLNQSTTALAPFLADLDSTLDADPLN
jgi:hypothetical protein